MVENKILRYSCLIVIRPSSQWKLDVLTFTVDDNIEFLQQWLAHGDDPLNSIITHMHRVTGIYPLIISMNPIFTHTGNVIIDFYACTLPPLSRVNADIPYYDGANWRKPRSIYRLLKRDADKIALVKSIKWASSDNFTPLIMTRNFMIG